MFSAREVATLQTEFAKLGFTAKGNSQKSPKRNVSIWRKRREADLARAAEVAGSTLRAFGLRRQAKRDASPM